MNKLALLLALIACACEGRKPPQPQHEPERQRRVIDEVPSRGVRALPPHAIRADGVGPYKLGMTVTALLDQLPSGPRITQFTMPDVIQRDILRAEENAILIGAEPQGKSTFVAVVRPEIARTEAGVHVGSTRADLEAALGQPLAEPDRVRDPRVVSPTGMPNARFVFDADRIVAIVIVAEPERPVKDKDGGREGSAKETKDDKDSRHDTVSTSGDQLSFVRDGDKPIVTRVPDLVFAATLRNPGDGRDDIVAITRSETAQAATWSLVGYRPHEGKLVRVIEPYVLYKLTDANARWIGADIHDLDLYLELTGRSDSIEVGGLLTTRAGDKIRDIVVISPVPVPRRRPKAASHEPTDAGIPDAPTPLRP